MEEVSTVLGKDATIQSRHSRDEVVAKVISFEQAVEKLGISQRCFAEAVGVPRSTLQGWLDTKESIDASPALVAFLESPEGVVFLHRLVLAAQIVITLMGAGGIRLVCTFLTLSGLAPFVASSYGAQQEAIATLEEHLGLIRDNYFLQPASIIFFTGCRADGLCDRGLRKRSRWSPTSRSS